MEYFKILFLRMPYSTNVLVSLSTVIHNPIINYADGDKVEEMEKFIYGEK